MLSVAEAQAVVLRHARPLPPITVELTPQALGLVLAEDVSSDLDMPPFDKALMDGFAVRSADLAAGRLALRVTGEIAAGQTPNNPLGSGEAVQIMTGAPLPDGADTVIMIERTRREGDKVVVEAAPAGANVLGKAREMKRGEVVLPGGTVLRPQEFGLLATVGRTSVSARPRPNVAVLPTGDELVEAGEKPGAGKIRNGNGPMLLAQVARAGGVPRYLGIARDNVESHHAKAGEGLESHLLILSGGVSAGKRDLVPEVLEQLGVQAHFHRVLMKPGKPVLFGSRGERLVFGLPGNPVSAMVCFELFVRPAIRILCGQRDPGPFVIEATLSEDFSYRSDRPTYHPARLATDAKTPQVRLTSWFGSADLRAVASANAFAILPAGENQLRAGQLVPVLKIEN